MEQKEQQLKQLDQENTKRLAQERMHELLRPYLEAKATLAKKYNIDLPKWEIA